MKSIQTKFMVIILAGILLSSIIIGGAGVVSSQKVVNRDSEMIMNLLCSENAKNLDNILEKIEQSVDVMASYALEQLESPKMLEDEEYRNSYTAEMEKLLLNTANNTEGALAVYLRYNPEYTPSTAGLFWSKMRTDGTFEWVEPTDFSQYSPSDNEHVGWYYIPVGNGGPTWMNPYLNKNINIYMISYVVPLYKDHVLVGIIGMDIEFDLITNVVDEIVAYENGYAFLTDENGQILHHREIQQGTPAVSVEGNLQDLADCLSDKTSGDELISYTYEGTDMEMVFRSLANGMRLGITAPSAEIDREKNNLIWKIVLCSAFICAFFTVITIFTTGNIIRPLKELTEAAKKIAGGDLSVSLACQSKDEVGTLADSFRQTVSHLQKYIDYINGLAYRDVLTGAKNKTAYQEKVDSLEEQMHHGKPEFAVMIFDVNNLKHSNDTYGHDFGDGLILDAYKVISRIFSNSQVYRIGGDEFVVILENADYENYPRLVEEFTKIMETENQSTTDEQPRVSIAHGIAVYEQKTDLVYANVFKRADKAMYANKADMKKKQVMM